MEFRHLYSFNLALLDKHGWKLLYDPNSLAKCILKAKYLPTNSFLITQL